ncbi:MAG: glutamine--fructose-6-phosphate transaminase (isomerizing) [Anaerolineae bacterium]|nr:glutamine--fructose-6-phosphate transaminase (isomerizing) [Anaerolineae bacterium]
MCGIVGYVGPRDAPPLIFEGLKRLEYRGYDSAGLAVVQPDRTIGIRREVGKLARLGERLDRAPLSGHVGIGHTRWATHGQPSERNAHPHLGPSGEIAVVHNGIIENFCALRDEMAAEGHRFASETDTEVVAHLVEGYLAAGASLETAVRQTLARVKGANAFLFLSRSQPDRIVGARLGNAGGLTVGLGEGENLIASDIPAILEHTRQMVFVENRQIVTITQEAVRIETLDGQAVPIVPYTIPWDPVAAAKEPYRHFMQKEIYEQARSITDTIRGRADFDGGRVRLESLEMTAAEAQQLAKIVIVACGTSAYAGQVGKFIIEALARVPVEVDYGSEFRYRDPLLDQQTAVLAITQSGETVDTLAAMEEGRGKGARLWSIVNVIGSQAHRIADGYIQMHAGPEIGVASTKAFTTSLVDLYLLGCYLGELRGTLPRDVLRQRIDDLAGLPDLVGRVLDHGQEYEQLAQIFYDREHFLYLGRGINYPVALEGALKLKEISYIHAEGYPAGEMKHGPIALIDEAMPVVAIVMRDHVYDKMVNQVEQVKARGGTVIALVESGNGDIAAQSDHVLAVPPAPYLLSPVVNVIPLQLLAYHLALRRGCDVDQPRNLAKSVTVE